MKNKRTDIEVHLPYAEGDYRFSQSSTVGGGALSQTNDGSTLRIIFHDDSDVIGEGTFVTYVLRDKGTMTVRRKSGLRVLIETQRAGKAVERTEFGLSPRESRKFADPYGREANAKCIYHDDFELFPRS